jgi:deferrochelatase/peroxidase EfeB
MGIDWNDVQAIVLRGYKRLEAASCLLLEIENSGRAKDWLKETAARVTRGKRDPNRDEDHAINVAFTHSGLRKLEVAQADLDAFSLEFREGTTPDRCRNVLGDDGESDPKNWRWGQGDKIPDVLLLIYAKNATDLEALKSVELKRGAEGGVAEIGVRLPDSLLLEGMREHFGFRDGLSQPEIDEEAPREGAPPRPPNRVAPGEFLLGYENERRQLYDPGLPAELGRNGSYLVLRQLAQEVAGFWRYLDEQSYDEKDRETLAAKMMGRWRNGTPLADDSRPPEDNGFGYRNDPSGLRCPLGAHVRRANPRDTLSANEADPFDVSRMHRIIRRGRPYGAPLDPSWEPAKMLEAARSPAGYGAAGARADADEFSIQGRPLRRHLSGLPRFVRVRGGAYFFVPGVQGLLHLAQRY